MSAVKLLDETLDGILAELWSYREWAAWRVCDCEALVQLRGVELADVERHRTDCRFVEVARELAGE
jgi:hypothetical protein